MMNFRCLYCLYWILIQISEHLTHDHTAPVNCNDPIQMQMNGGCKLTVVPTDEVSMCAHAKEMIKNLCPVNLLRNIENVCKDDTLQEIIENGCMIQLISPCDTMADIINNKCGVQIIEMDELEGKCDTIDNIIKNSCDVQLISYCNTIDEIVVHQCEIHLIPTGEIISECEPCSPPIRVDKKTKFTPKAHCNGDLSIITVNGQRCKMNEFGLNTCMVGGEGFSFCSTEYLFFRDGHWVDWDLCSLCTKDDLNSPLTAHGYRCDGECNNLWQNREIDAPRCKVKDRSASEPSLDFCTTCTSSCANVKVDDRPGSQVKRLDFSKEKE